MHSSPASPSLGLVRHMSRVGSMSVKVPPNVQVSISPIDPEHLMPAPTYSKKRVKHHLRHTPKADSFSAFGTPHRVVVEGPLGTLALPIHSYCKVEQPQPEEIAVSVQCGGETKMGKALWGTTRGHIANAIRGVSQGWRKDLELHGIGFRGRVVKSTEARPPAGEREVWYRLGVEKYGQSVHHKGPGPAERPDPARGGAIMAGAGGGYRKRRPPLRPEGYVTPVRTRHRGAPVIDGGGKRLAAGTDGTHTYPLDGGSPDAARFSGDTLMLRLGFAHESRVDFPPHLTVTTPTPTTVSIFGIDKQQVGLAAARVRLLRKADPYKGKGVRYAGEVIKLKATKR